MLTAYFTFVAVDGRGRPRDVPALVPRTADEKKRYQAGAERRDQRLANRKGTRDSGRRRGRG